jgi:hypothetical protein
MASTDIVPQEDDPYTMSLEENRSSSLLLNLPVELLQNVLRQMDISTFYVSLLTCRTIYKAAESSKDVLLHHANSLPGIKLGLDDLDTEDLFLEVRKRAAKNVSGIGIFTNLEMIRFEGHDVNIKESVLQRRQGMIRLALACKDEPIILLYCVHKDALRLIAKLTPDWRGECDMQLMKMCFSNDGDVAGLYRWKPRFSSTCLTKFNEDASTKWSGCTMKLVTFSKVSANTYPPAPDMRPWQETRDVSFVPDEEPVGMALGIDGTAVISWKSWRDDDFTGVTVYDRDKFVMARENYGKYLSIKSFKYAS